MLEHRVIIKRFLLKFICLCFNNSVASQKINVSFKKKIILAQQNLQKAGTLSKQQPPGRLDAIAGSFYLQNTTVPEYPELAQSLSFFIVVVVFWDMR